jgi:glutamate-ammonia-ligase adenylyltransferase
MALTRARPVYGSESARADLQGIIANVLGKPRDVAELATAVVGMRADIALNKPPVGPLDVKLCDGGLVDLEFAVHFRQLASGVGIVPELSTAIAQLAEAGLTDPGLKGAAALLTRLLVTLRLVSPTMAEPAPATCAIIARACGAADWSALLAQLEDARHIVSASWKSIVDQVGTA